MTVYTREQVRAFWHEMRARGRHAGTQVPHDETVLLRYEEWVLVELPLDDLEAIPDEPALVQGYAKREGVFPPGIGIVEDGRHGSFVDLTDGNHRACAARERGETKFRSFVPLADLEYLRPSWRVLTEPYEGVS